MPRAERAFTLAEAMQAAHRKGLAAQTARLAALAQPLFDGLGVDISLALPATTGTSGTKARARFGWDSLTETERKIIELVATGLSNTQIASQLICSRRTIESHLHHVYTKLAVSSRVELVVDALARDSTVSPGSGAAAVH